MNLLLSQLVSTFLQLALLLAIPFIYWKKPKPPVNFFYGLGVKKAGGKKWPLIFFGLAVFVLFSIMGYFSLKCIPQESLANAKFKRLNLPTSLAILLYCFFQTSLGEELFFRGFLGKLLIKKLGFIKGNLSQALLFGLVHGSLIFSSQLSLSALCLIILFPTVLGFCLGYLNEKLAEGSILPSWLIHGGANLMSTLVLIFKLV